LFWLSLFPFATAWMGENHAAPLPSAAYGVVLLMAAIAYYVLQQTIIVHQGSHSLLASTVGRDWKGKLSPVLYLGEKHALRMPALRAHDREFNFHARSQGGILKPYESIT